MKKWNRIALMLLIGVGVSSCELVENDLGLSTEDVVEGLKKALELGTDSASSSLTALNGYYEGHEEFVKIPLPEEAEQVRQLITNNQLASLFNLDNQFENVVKAVNRAAETAARDAAPVFKDAITDLSISEGWDILNGTVPATAGLKAGEFDSTAATEYLKLETFDAITDVYSPYVNTALGKDLGLGFSAVDAWNTLTTSYNTTLNSNAVQAALTLLQFSGSAVNMPKQIETDLGVFSTQKALDGLFYKVGKEEKKIRKDPFAWAIDIIQKVFGSGN